MIRKLILPKFGAAALITAAMMMGVPPAGAQPDGGGYVLQRLHSDLQLTSSQETAWNTFQQAYRVDPREISREREADSRMAGLTGPQRMDQAVSMAEQDLAEMRRRGDALKAFYSTLSPDQQKVFDRDTLPPAGN